MEPSKANYLTSGYVRCKLPGKSLVFSALVDSGNLSKYDLISESLAKRLKIPMHPSPLELGTAGKGQKLSVLGQCESFNIYIEKCGEMFEISPHVVRGLSANMNLGPRFLTNSNSDLRFRENQRPKLIIRNGERELELLGNDVMNVPSDDEVFNKILSHFHKKDSRLVKNTVLDLGLDPAEEMMDLPGAVYALEEDKTLTTVGNSGRNVYCQDKIEILPGCLRYVKSWVKGFKLTNYGVMFQGLEQNWNLYKKKCLPLSGLFKTDETGHIYVPVMNMNLVTVKIDKGQKLGHAFLEEATSESEVEVNELTHKKASLLTAAEKLERAVHITKKLKLDESEFLKDRPDLKKRTIELFLEEFDAVSLGPNDIGETDIVTCKLDLKPGATPYQGRPIPLNPIMEENLRKQVQEWLDSKTIEPSFSQWGSAIFPVAKKVEAGSAPKWRWVVNYKEVNARLTTQNYPIPQIENNLQRLGNARVFSALDSVSAYSAVKMADETSKDITTFTCVLGTFRYLRMPFGLAIAPSLYQNLVQRALQMLPGSWKYALSYLDDLVVFSSSLEDHM